MIVFRVYKKINIEKTMESSSEVVNKVRRDKIAACMTCPLCNKLLKEATTISLCLHTFCRKCIYEKLSDEDVDSCPVCGINLGCIPVDKLRPDPNLQDIRAKIFPFKRRKIEVPQTAPAISPPLKTKERLLSSLAVSTRRVSVRRGVTKWSAKAGVKKGSAQRASSLSIRETPIKDHMDGSSSPETLSQTIQNQKQSLSVKFSNDQIHVEHVNNVEGRGGKTDLWKPLNTLVEAANRSKFSKTSSQYPNHIKTNPNSLEDADVFMIKFESEKIGEKVEVQGEKSNMPAKHKRMRQANKNRMFGSVDSSDTKHLPTLSRRDWRECPIWFSLAALEEQDGVDPLPQVSLAFLKVRDVNAPVSSIQTYLMKKLNLASKDEVQIMCYGQPLVPQLQLNSLLDLWRRTLSTSKKFCTFTGHSANGYVMPLSYSRKVAVPGS